MLDDVKALEGRGGGKKSAPSQVDDTLRSTARALLVDAIGEGPIEGLVDGSNSILVNRTPLSNIEDCRYWFRRGLASDSAIPGVKATEAYMQVNAEISEELGPIIRTVNNLDTDLIRIYVTLNYLYRTTNKSGLHPDDGGWIVDVRPAGGAWETRLTFELNYEKTTSPVQFQHDIRLKGTGPWDIRVRNRLPDRLESSKVSEQMYWTGISAVTEGKYTYPNTAICALDLSSEHVGGSEPQRLYHVRGRRIKVPVNYDPETRQYTGVWNGQFKIAYSNNPAWCTYDMVENRIFGLGDEVGADLLDKWTLYSIAQWCDGLVPSGYKTAGGADIMEPRYTFNGVINTKREALDAIRQMVSTWRGMSFLTQSQFYVTADRPADVAHVYGPANVIDGRFEYSETSLKARHSVVMVRYNDPNNLFESAIEPVIDDELVRKYGWREKTLELIGCSSRSMANRYGRWVIDTEKNETETVAFKVGMGSIHALPGEIIGINDPRRAEVRLSGRVVSHVDNQITLDAPVPAGISGTVTLRVERPNGTLGEFTCTIASGNRSLLNVSAGPAITLPVNAAYLLSSNQVSPRLYRIVSIDELDDQNGTTFQITALTYDPNKFARVERGIIFDPKPVRLDKTKVGRPQNLTVGSVNYSDRGRVRTNIMIDWDKPDDTLVRAYRVVIDTPTAKGVLVTETVMHSAIHTVLDEPGTYTIKVCTINIAGRRSGWVKTTHVVEGMAGLGVGYVADLVNRATGLGTGSTFKTRDVTIQWRNVFPASSEGPEEQDDDDALYSHNTVRVYNGATLLRTQRVKGNSFNYTYALNDADSEKAGFPSARRALRFTVTVTDKAGRTSNPLEIELTNPAPPAFVPQVSSAGRHIQVTWPNSSSKDVAGYKVWIELEDDFNPYTTTPKFNGMGTFMSHIGVAAEPHYVRAAAYDLFGDESLNIAPPVMISTGLDALDTDAPATPTGLALASVLTDAGARLTATWNANTENDMLGYIVQIREAGGNDVAFTTDSNRYSWEVQRGRNYTVSVRAYDRSGNRSNYSAEVTHMAMRDTVPPAVPTGLTGRPGFGVHLLEWASNTETDLSHYEIYVGTTSAAPAAGASAQHSTRANILSISGLEDGTRRFYRVRAVDTSGNRSAWAGPVDLTSTTIEELDFTGILDETAFATGLEPVRVVTTPALPTTKLTSMILWNGVAYRWNGTAYTASVGAELINGQLVAGQIAAGAIGADQLAANAITAKKMLVADWANPLVGSEIEATSGWTAGASGAWDAGTTYQGKAQSMRLIGTGSTQTAFTFSNAIPVTPGDEYHISFWMRRTALWNGTAENSKLRIGNQSGALLDALSFAAADGAAGVWTRRTMSFKVPAGVSALNLTLVGNATDGYCYLSDLSLRRKNSGELQVDGSIEANHLTVDGEIITDSIQIRDAIITDAHIVDLTADKLTAGSALAASITVSGTALSTIRGNAATGAQDPAARINSGATLIDPGKIVISGATTLRDWRGGGDVTKINGGAIEANTVSANVLRVGLRGITLTSIQFEHNSPATNQVSWSAGAVRYTNDAGSAATANIAAGQATWTSGVLYIYWAKGATVFTATTSLSTANQDDNVIIATYQGGTKLDADYGRTIIDGSSIKTRTIKATQLIETEAVITNTAQIEDATITKAHIKDLAVDTLKIAGNAVSVIVSAAATGSSVTLNISPDHSFSLVILAVASNVVGTDTARYAKIFWNGNEAEKSYYLAAAVGASVSVGLSVPVVHRRSGSAGNHTIRFEAGAGAGASTDCTLIAIITYK
jgi:predicted phage tail protein/carbonic anhydrase/acetyltransferase-like protein (isoleucine patch superfamily)